MHIDAICETNGKGWLIWAAQCPGAFARGATENEALAKLRATCGASCTGPESLPGTSPSRRAHPSKAACTPRTPIPTCCSRPTAPR